MYSKCEAASKRGSVGVSLTGTQNQPDFTPNEPGIKFKPWEAFI